MLRLTLRDGHDGRLLARIIDRDGYAFVLDYGDRAVVADAARKVMQGGFLVRWEEVIEEASPGSPTFFRLLAMHYATEGLLVSVDEPTWTRRAPDRRLEMTEVPLPGHSELEPFPGG
ncbi:MAG TPA: hypothetical protein ENK18_19430 [Deltaproteobacteria bacterium]|nr:hypothetical protein [Deltaproteobacteria bacterium]